MSQPTGGQIYSQTQRSSLEAIEYAPGSGIKFEEDPGSGVTKISTIYGAGAFAQVGQNLQDIDDPTDAPFPYRHGVDQRTATFSYASGVLTVTYVSDWDWWYQGAKTTVYADKTVDLDSDRTLYYVYLDSDGTLTATDTPWDQTATTQVFVALVYRVSSSLAAIGDERHSSHISRAWHAWAHETIGARYNTEVGGLAGTFGNTTFTVTAGEIYDEDLVHVITEQTTCRRWYRYTGGAAMTFDDNQTVLYSLNGTNIQYDNAGTLTDASNQYYVNHYVYATNDQDYPIYSLIGQGQYATIAGARDESPPGFANLTDAEWKLLYRVTYRNTGSPPTYTETADYRYAVGVPVNFVPTDHGSLSGLGDDDHPQYIRHNLSTAANDFLVGSGSNTFEKQTLAATADILETELDHGSIQGLTDDDHTQYIRHNLSTAENDFLVGTGSNTFGKKTLAEAGAILEADIEHGNIQGLSDSDHPVTALAFTATDKVAGRTSAGAGAGEELNRTVDLLKFSATAKLAGRTTAGSGNGEEIPIVTSVGDPGADTNIPTEAAVRTAITASGGVTLAVATALGSL